jgi:two-component system CheB/CheR fusion protein
LNGIRILVVDDDGDAREAIAEALKLAGAIVDSEANVRDGLRVFDDGAIDIVVSDIAMPVEDGYFFIRELRAREQDEPRTPVLALTAMPAPKRSDG